MQTGNDTHRTVLCAQLSTPPSLSGSRPRGPRAPRVSRPASSGPRARARVCVLCAVSRPRGTRGCTTSGCLYIITCPLSTEFHKPPSNGGDLCPTQRAHQHTSQRHPPTQRYVRSQLRSSAWPLALHVLRTIEPERFLLNDLLLRLQQLRVHLNLRRVVDIVAHAKLVALEHVALARTGKE